MGRVTLGASNNKDLKQVSTNKIEIVETVSPQIIERIVEVPVIKEVEVIKEIIVEVPKTTIEYITIEKPVEVEKIVEVVREKMVEVPVIKEKIVHDLERVFEEKKKIVLLKRQIKRLKWIAAGLSVAMFILGVICG